MGFVKPERKMKTLTRQELAERLNNCERGEEISKELEQLAKENNLVVLFGYSDDGLEIRGAIYDELGAYNGGEFALIKKGELYSDEEEENTYHKTDCDSILPLSEEYAQPEEKERRISLKWLDEGDKSWEIETQMPHSKFLIREEAEPFSDGIVIDLDEVN